MRVVVAAATTTHITADEAPGTAGSRRDARDSSWCWEAPMAVTQTRESSSPAPRGPFTYKHLQHLRDRLDERYRCEIINGKLFVSPSPGLPHQWVVTQLVLWLGNHVRAHKLGMVLVAPLDVIFSKVDVVVPDLLYLTNEQLARTPDRGVQEAPTLVVEILSP